MKLNIENLDFSYGSVQVLNDISMEFEAAQITCVMGRNGVGKTTLLHNVMGILNPSRGKIQLDGSDVAGVPAYRRARMGLGLVPQGRQIFPKLTVQENLQVGLQGRRDRIRRVPDEIYDLFPILGEMRRRKGGDLSGGQQQQLSIGRALAGNPNVLLLDEPTEGIQPNIIQQIGQVLIQLVEQTQMTVVLVEQYLDFVREYGHVFYVMDRGRVMAKGSTSDLTEEIVNTHLTI
jgi:urea transport system ATP-binding protein